MLKVVTANSSSNTDGSSVIEIVEGATVSGSATATATNDAAVTNAGEVEGAVTTRAGNGSASTFDQTVVYDGKGVLLSNTNKQTNGPTGELRRARCRGKVGKYVWISGGA